MYSKHYHFPPERYDHEFRSKYNIPSYGIGKQRTLHVALTIYGAIVFLIFFIIIMVSVNGPTERAKYGIDESRVFSRVVVHRLKKNPVEESTKWKQDMLYKWNQSNPVDHRKEIQRLASRLVKEFVGLRVNQDDFAQKYNTCALVSNSGQLLRSNAGDEINSAECIIRMNNAPTTNFSRDVGNRTTVRVCSFQAVGNIKQSIYLGKEKPNYVLMWGMDNPRRRSWSRLRLRKLARMFPDQQFFSLKNQGEHIAEAVYESETGIDRGKTQSWLSTGWFTMLFALHACQNVTVYGLVSEDFCRNNPGIKTPYHYYEENKFDECEMYSAHETDYKQGHRYLTEKSVFHRFATLFNMTFSYPEWDMASYNESSFYSPFLQKLKNTTKSKR